MVYRLGVMLRSLFWQKMKKILEPAASWLGANTDGGLLGFLGDFDFETPSKRSNKWQDYIHNMYEMKYV